jgi:hypothetical protein
MLLYSPLPRDGGRRAQLSSPPAKVVSSEQKERLYLTGGSGTK